MTDLVAPACTRHGHVPFALTHAIGDFGKLANRADDAARQENRHQNRHQQRDQRQQDRDPLRGVDFAQERVDWDHAEQQPANRDLRFRLDVDEKLQRIGIVGRVGDDPLLAAEHGDHVGA